MNRQTGWRLAALICGIGLTLWVTACGGGSDGPATTPTPVVATPRVVQQGNFNLKAPEGDSAYFALANVTDSTPGLWEASVDWAIPTNTLWMWVSNGACTADQFSRADCPFETTCPCQFTIRSETATPKPRVLTIPNAPGGTRTLIVLNLGPREEAGTYRVMLTPSSLVANSMTSASQSAMPVTIGRKTMTRR